MQGTSSLLSSSRHGQCIRGSLSCIAFSVRCCAHLSNMSDLRCFRALVQHPIGRVCLVALAWYMYMRSLGVPMSRAIALKG